MNSEKQTYSGLWVHLVWATKHRESMIKKEIKYLLYDQFRAISKEKGYGLDFINGVEDHVHLLVNLEPKFAISSMVKDFKAYTWKWAQDFLDEDHYITWQDGFSAFSVSPDRVEKVRNYIKNQEKHHASQSLDEELKILKEQ